VLDLRVLDIYFPLSMTRTPSLITMENKPRVAGGEVGRGMGPLEDGHKGGHVME